MAYTKQTWTNDVTAITAERMTHIENGIYDNSLATDKINPSGTATTIAEIEEGQITDVIGFKSLKLKGQTSQYTTTGSQLFDLSNTNVDTQYNYNNGFKLTKSTNRTREITLRTPIPSGNYYISADVINSTLSNNNQMYVTFKGANNTNVLENVRFLNNGAVTINAEVVSLYFFVANSEADTATITLDNIMLNSGSTRKDFEKYTGSKASPNPDFPQEVNNVSGDNVVRISNKNLYDKDDSNLIMNNVYINATGFVLTSSNNMKTICMPCRANTTYTVSKTLSSRFIIGTASSNTIGTSMTAGRTNPSGTQVSVTSGANDKYLFVFYYHGSADTKTEQEIRNSIQVEIGSTATTYTAHQGNDFDIDLPVENLYDYTKSEFASTSKAVIRLIDNGFIAEVITTATSQDFFFRTRIDDNLLVDGETYTVSYEAIKGVRKPLQLQLRNRDGSYASQSMATSVTYDSDYGLFVVNNIFNESNTATVEAGTIAIVKNIQVERGTKIHAYTPYGTNPIELCKISTYEDYIFKKDGKWYLHKEIGSQTFNGSESWTAVTTNQSGIYRPQINLGNMVSGNIVKPSSNANVGLILCDHYKPLVAGSAGTYGANEGISLDVSGYVQTYNDDYTTNDISLYKTWLASNNITIYWVYSTPIDEEITYAPLLRQLDELYNSGLYDVTNISQDNSGEAFILDFEACKNNINGIVEYIRR